MVALLLTGAIGLPFAILFSLELIFGVNVKTVSMTLGYWSLAFLMLTTGVNLIFVIPAIILCVKFRFSWRIVLPAASLLFLVVSSIVAFETGDGTFHAVALMVYCVSAFLIGLEWAMRSSQLLVCNLLL
jgi:hypothetical protein